MSARLTPHGCIVTSAGIVIGGAYVPPPQQQSHDAEVIQGALLRTKPRGMDGDALVMYACAAAAFALVLLGANGLLPGGGA